MPTPEWQTRWAEQIAGWPDDPTRPVLAAVAACPDRGSVLPAALQPEGCSGCAELTECRAGRGATPGRVTLEECVACRFAALRAAGELSNDFLNSLN